MEEDITLKFPDQGPALELAPAEGQAAAKARVHYEIDIFNDWCKACGICAAFCPRQCISLDGDGLPFVDPLKRCTGCRWCEMHCPDFAICIREAKPPKPKIAEDD